MASVLIKRKNNFQLRFRAIKIFVDDVFVDYLEIGELEKEIEVNPRQKKLRLKIDWCYSNSYALKFDEKDNLKNKVISVTSQIHNGLFILIYGVFFSGSFLWLFGLIGPYMYLGSLSPMLIIVYWQTFGKQNFLRLSNTAM